MQKIALTLATAAGIVALRPGGGSRGFGCGGLGIAYLPRTAPKIRWP